MALRCHRKQLQNIADSEDTCGQGRQSRETVFSLTISRSFDPEVTFKLCDRIDRSKRFLLVASETARHSEKWATKSIPVDPRQYDKIVALYEKALEYDVKDDAMGLDGSSWCLETRRGFTYSKACFWTPHFEPTRRRLDGLLELGNELWRLAKLDPKRLY